MIVVYPKGHCRGEVVMNHSIDAGLTCSKRLLVPENWSNSKDEGFAWYYPDKIYSLKLNKIAKRKCRHADIFYN